MSSPFPLILPEMAHSFPDFLPFRESSLTTSSSKTSTPSIYVTFKVLQLVNAFRNRVRTRVQNTKRTPPKEVQDDFCQEFERQAFEEIDRYLGRKPAHTNKRRWKSSKASTVAAKDSAHKSIDELLNRLNLVVKAEELSLTTVAKSEQLFVQRKSDFDITRGHISHKELIELLVTAIDLLESIRRNYQSPGARTLCGGNEILDIDLNETFTANLEHLLLCLKGQLLRLLVAKLVGVVYAHVIECQRDQSKHGDDWFFEFPDSQHPLSTTWPWSIRPSLAVLWGVCWMFYDYNQLFFDQYGNMVNERGEVVLESQVVHHFFNNPARQHLDFYPVDPVPRQNYLPPTNMAETRFSSFQPSLATSHASQNSALGVVSPVAHASRGLNIRGTNNAYAVDEAQPTQAATAANDNYWLPQDHHYPTSSFDYSANTYAADVGSWEDRQPVPAQQQQPGFAYAQTLPPNTRRPLPPDIRVTTEFPNNPAFQILPQDVYYSESAVSSASPIPSHDTGYPAQFANYLSPQKPRPMALDQQDNMQTPPRSPHRHATVDEAIMSRKRSHSDMSAGAGPLPPSAGSRSGSVGSNAEYSEGHSPRGRTQKREDPPTNEHNKYICHFAPECAALTFDRKCEWSKHMDKHDRPYRCPDPACAKLQGFTYSGGLLRHEREVHGKHGGPKAQLPCPYADCKRHGGKGFTRKENLHEHIRRVHQSKDQPSQPTPMRRDATDAFGGAEELESPADIPILSEDHTSPAMKRRRHDTGLIPDHGTEGLESLKMELARLREEVDEKDRRLMEMELKFHDERTARDTEVSNLQETIRQLQQQQTQGHG